MCNKLATNGQSGFPLPELDELRVKSTFDVQHDLGGDEKFERAFDFRMRLSDFDFGEAGLFHFNAQPAEAGNLADEQAQVGFMANNHDPFAFFETSFKFGEDEFAVLTGSERVCEFEAIFQAETFVSHQRGF